MKRNIVFKLVRDLSKIYFSDEKNDESAYKKKIFYILKDLGGVYTKFLQSLCTTQRFMDGWGTPKEYEIFDKVKIESIDITKYININNYKYVETHPFASGSFAQIYRARLKNNKEVIIKVLRPSISKNLESDLEKLRKIVKVMSFFLPNKLINYNDAFYEFNKTCLLEMDYKQEIANLEYFYNLYKDNDKIIIPKVYKRLSSKYVIVEEYINGPTLASFMVNSDRSSISEEVKELTGSNIWEQLAMTGGEFLRCAIFEDFVFGDPHPGNILILPDNKIALIDFGIISRRPTSRQAFYMWVKSYYDVLYGKNDYSELIENTCLCFNPDLTIALKKYVDDKDIINSLAQEFTTKLNNNICIDKSALENADSGHIATLFSGIMSDNDLPDIEFDMTNFNLIKAMALFISSVTTIDNKSDNNMYRTLMLNAIEYVLDYSKVYNVPRDLVYTTRYSRNDAYTIFTDIIASIANKNEVLFERISERMGL